MQRLNTMISQDKKDNKTFNDIEIKSAMVLTYFIVFNNENSFELNTILNLLRDKVQIWRASIIGNAAYY